MISPSKPSMHCLHFSSEHLGPLQQSVHFILCLHKKMYELNYIAHLAEAQTNVKATKKNGSVCKKENMYEMWVCVVLYGLYSYVFHCLLVQRVTSTDQGSM